jgi:hypothetical protein
MAHKLGTPVRQIVHPIVGRVMRTQYNESMERNEHLVESPDGTQSVWLPADQLEVDQDQLAKDKEAAPAEGEQA